MSQKKQNAKFEAHLKKTTEIPEWQTATFNWFPGHMNKTLKNIEEKRSMVDLLIELVDARAPISTQNLTFKKLLGQKPRLFLLTKTDLADPLITRQWQQYFAAINQPVFTLDYRQPGFINQLNKQIMQTMAEKLERQKAKGLLNPQINALVVGVPNVGKSTFINSLVKNKKVKVGNQPGVTRGLQILQLSPQVNLIDTPGVLPPHFANAQQANIFAMLNNIPSTVFPIELVSDAAWEQLQEQYPDIFTKLPWNLNAEEAILTQQRTQFLKQLADGLWPVTLELPPQLETKDNEKKYTE